MALKVLRSQPELRHRLWNHADLLYQRLKESGFSLGPAPSPIIAINCRGPEKTAAIWKGLLDRGIYVNMVLPPATPGGKALLRLSLSASHTREQIEKIGDAFVSLRQIIL